MKQVGTDPSIISCHRLKEKNKMKLKDQILHCLEVYPETRNSDITLMIRIWQTFTNKVIYSKKTKEHYIKVKDLYDLPREDWVKRIRAKIQNENNLFLPTDPEVIKARKKNQKKWLRQLNF